VLLSIVIVALAPTPSPTMPKQTKKRIGKKLADAPYKKGQAKPKAKKPEKNVLFEKRPRNFGIGQDIQPKRDLTRFVRWPKYIRMQRQKRVLLARLKVPPAVHQFSRVLDKSLAKPLFELLDRYKPETKAEKKKRLVQRAKEIAELKEGEKPQAVPQPHFVKYGINHVTSLVESKKAKLLVIAHDVEPIELVVWLPALARRMGVPYCIVKSKSRLGQLVHKKTATAVAITSVRKEDQQKLDTLTKAINENYNERYDDLRKQWGGGALGKKSQALLRQKAKQARAEKVEY